MKKKYLDFPGIHARIWLDLAGFGWIWLNLAEFGWIWLNLAEFGWILEGGNQPNFRTYPCRRILLCSSSSPIWSAGIPCKQRRRERLCWRWSGPDSAPRHAPAATCANPFFLFTMNWPVNEVKASRYCRFSRRQIGPVAEEDQKIKAIYKERRKPSGFFLSQHLPLT